MRAKTSNKQYCKAYQNISLEAHLRNHMESDLTGLVAAVRDSISACVIHILLVDCKNSRQAKHLCQLWWTLMMLGVRVCSCCFFKPSLTERVLAGAEGLVRDTISWMAKRSLSLCRGLLMPISLWISVSDRFAMMAPLFTLARHAATYHAGIPTQSWEQSNQRIIDLWNWQSHWKHFTFSGFTARHTSSQVTTVGPSHDAKGRPWRHASSNRSCLAKNIILTTTTSTIIIIKMSLFFFVYTKRLKHFRTVEVACAFFFML